MAHIGVAGFLDGVVINVNHVVEHAHGCRDGDLELVVIDFAVLQVLEQVDRAQVANRCFGVAGVQCDLGAQIR